MDISIAAGSLADQTYNIYYPTETVIFNAFSTPGFQCSDLGFTYVLSYPAGFPDESAVTMNSSTQEIFI